MVASAMTSTDGVLRRSTAISTTSIMIRKREELIVMVLLELELLLEVAKVHIATCTENGSFYWSRSRW